MRRSLNWFGGALWGIAVYRLWKRWRGEEAESPWPEPAPAEGPDDTPDDRAEELRARLAENRAADEPSPVEPEPPESLEERRRRVHEEGRSAIDEMRGD